MSKDTIALLKECNAGCKSATNSMEQVLEFTKEGKLKEIIEQYNKKHIELGDKCHELLNKVNEEEKDPHPMAKAFSWISTEMKMMVNDGEEKIADIMVDGCNMGIKSLSKYLNQYKEAEGQAKDIARELIRLEQDFMVELLEYL